jgi:LacI family transcriptional regulator
MVVRLKDIAAELGVSVVTVSRALRNQPDIAKETKARILACMKRLNYRPNLTARGLVTGRSFLVGLVVPDLIRPFFAEIAKGLSSRLREKNFSLIISSSECDPKLEQDEIDNMQAHHMDCLVVASCQKDATHLKKIAKSGVPLILVDRRYPDFACNFVGVDDCRMGELATAHLIAQGCQRIAHVRGPALSVGDGRAEGYRKALLRHGLKAPARYLIECGNLADLDGEACGRQAMETILALKPRPDGVFCFNDTIAFGAMMRAVEAGLRIPGDIAFIGCGNLHYSGKLQVPLSSADQQARAIGERAAGMVSTLVDQPSSAQARIIILQPKVITRASSQLKKARPGSAVQAGQPDAPPAPSDS